MNNSPVKRLTGELTAADIQLKEELKSILQSVQQEKKAIEEEFQSMKDRIERYRELQEKVEREAKQSKAGRSKEEQFIYAQLKSTLAEMNINGDQILELAYQQQQEEADPRWRKLDKTEVVRVQKLLIDRLLTKLREESELLRS